MAKPNGVIYSSVTSPQHPSLYGMNKAVNDYRQGSGHLSMSKLKFLNKESWCLGGKQTAFRRHQGGSFVCWSKGTRDTETEERMRHYGDCSNILSPKGENDDSVKTAKNISSSQGLAEAFKFVFNDAKFVNKRAKNDIVLLSRGIMRLDARARRDVAFLSSEFLKLNARAREDTEKIDNDVKRRAERLHHIATILKNKAQCRLRRAADKHWSDGALEVDLKRADFVAKRRAMEDSLMALEFVENIHDMMVNKTYRLKPDSINISEVRRYITLEKNGKISDFFPGEVSAERIDAIQEAYWSIASALSEADGIDYTDPEELELLVATLIDLDAMDGKSSASLLAECSNSPDDNTRRALANALSVAPSMWTLGNAGMGALQRLAEDSNPAIAAAATRTIYELKKQWDLEEGDSWNFMMNNQSSSLTGELLQDNEEEDDVEPD